MRWQKAETLFSMIMPEFLGEVAGLGADAIEVWNEMNIDREWPTGQIDPRRYKVMLEKAYTQIKAANPDTIVITGALAPTGAEGAFGLAAVWERRSLLFGHGQRRRRRVRRLHRGTL